MRRGEGRKGREEGKGRGEVYSICTFMVVAFLVLVV
jgi:hypothetical protein